MATLPVLVCLLVGGCASGTRTPVAAERSANRPPAAKAPLTAIARDAALFSSAYAQGDWSAIRAAFSDQAAGRALVGEMENWQAENVGSIHVSVVYNAPFGRRRYVATIEFASDPRAVPYYSIFLFGSGKTAGQIVGTTTGIRGSGYLHASWRVTRSAHFTVYHSPYELRGSDHATLASLEYQRRQFMRKFGVSLAPHVAYYYYPLQSLMSPLTHRGCGTTPDFVGCALPDASPPTIHTSEWPTYHEPIHIYELALEPRHVPGKPAYVAPLFIGEGTAVALEDREVDPRLSDYCSNLRYFPLDSCAQQAMNDVAPITLLSDSGFGRANAGDAYSLGGSFVKYLILHYGYHRFGRFYYVLAAQPLDRERDYNVATGSVYHRSIRTLLAAWKTVLCQNNAC